MKAWQQNLRGVATLNQLGRNELWVAKNQGQRRFQPVNTNTD